MGQAHLQQNGKTGFYRDTIFKLFYGQASFVILEDQTARENLTCGKKNLLLPLFFSQGPACEAGIKGTIKKKQTYLSPKLPS